MDRSTATEKLTSSEQHERLRAARFFSRFANADDAQMLLEALSDESVVWVKSALRNAIDRAQGHSGGEAEIEETAAERLGEQIEPSDEVYAEAVEHTTRQLLHEIKPVVGTLAYFAEKEIEEFEDSKTKSQLDRLNSLLDAIDRLSSAASAPSLKEFELSELIRRTARGEEAEHDVKVQLAGPSPLIVSGDEHLLELILQNAIRNAIEASEKAVDDSTPNPVVVNWDETDRDYWVAVLDEGDGPPVGLERAFDIGTTTKRHHLGMGLAVARQAIQSLSGTISLSPRSKEGGARLEFRWPKLIGAAE